jgi:hypothetical protein
MNGNNYLFISTIHEQRLADVERLAGRYPLVPIGRIKSSAARLVSGARRASARGLRGSAALLGWAANRLDARTPPAVG